MKVYIFIAGYDYIGDSILGVYSDKGIAKAKLKECEDLKFPFDSMRIEEHEVEDGKD